MLAQTLFTLAAAAGATTALDDERLERALAQWTARDASVLEVRAGAIVSDDAVREDGVIDLSGRPCGPRGEAYEGSLHVRTERGRLIAYGETPGGRAVGFLGAAGGEPRLLVRRTGRALVDVQMLARDLSCLLDPERLRRATAGVTWQCTDVEGGEGILFEGRLSADAIARERARHVSVFGEELGDLTIVGVDVGLHVGADGLLRGMMFDVRRVRESSRMVRGARPDEPHLELVQSEPSFVTYDVTFAEDTPPALASFAAEALALVDAEPVPAATSAPGPRWGTGAPSAPELRAACAWLTPRDAAWTLAARLRRPEHDPPRKRGGLDELATFASAEGEFVVRRARDGLVVLASLEALDGVALSLGTTRVREDIFSGLPRSVGDLESRLAFLTDPAALEGAVLAAGWTRAPGPDGGALVRGELDAIRLRGAAPTFAPWAEILVDVPGRDPAPIPATWVLDSEGRVRELQLTLGGDEAMVATAILPGPVIERARRTLVLRPVEEVPPHLAEFEERCRARAR